MNVEYTIISIGTMAQNRLWGEGQPVRTSHATTTLVMEGDRVVLVDPSLPSQVLSARFFERTGKQLDVVTDVFCTSLRPVHRRAIEAFPKANWYVNQPELETYRSYLVSLLDSAGRLGGEESSAIQADLKLVERFKPAPEKYGQQISLYPLVGPTVGSAGLLLTPAATTIVIAGDAAITIGHIEQGQIWDGSADLEAAKESLADLLELADVIVPGHDNVMLTPRRWL